MPHIHIFLQELDHLYHAGDLDGLGWKLARNRLTYKPYRLKTHRAMQAF